MGAHPESVSMYRQAPRGAAEEASERPPSPVGGAGPSSASLAFGLQDPVRWRISASGMLILTAALVIHLCWTSRHYFLYGYNDFLSFYAGAKLGGSSAIYDPDTISRIQLSEAGVTGPLLRYIRFPFHAALLSPFGLVPYPVAYVVWQVCCVAAFLAFLWTWPSPSRRELILASSCSVPALWSFVNGQDLPFLLLAIGLSIRLLLAGRPAVAGLAFAFCLAKFHLFLFVPLLLLRPDARRFAVGLMLGVSLLLTISFAVAGPGWPLDYWGTVLNGRIHNGMHHAPNAYGLGILPTAVHVRVMLMVVVGAGVWYIGRQTPFEAALSVAIIAGVFVSPHLSLHDTVLLLPAIVCLSMAMQLTSLTRMCALGLLIPLAHVLQLVVLFPASRLLAVILTVFLIFLAIDVYAQRQGWQSRTAGA